MDKSTADRIKDLVSGAFAGSGSRSPAARARDKRIMRRIDAINRRQSSIPDDLARYSKEVKKLFEQLSPEFRRALDGTLRSAVGAGPATDRNEVVDMLVASALSGNTSNHALGAGNKSLIGAMLEKVMPGILSGEHAWMMKAFEAADRLPQRAQPLMREALLEAASIVYRSEAHSEADKAGAHTGPIPPAQVKSWVDTIYRMKIAVDSHPWPDVSPGRNAMLYCIKSIDGSADMTDADGREFDRHCIGLLEAMDPGDRMLFDRAFAKALRAGEMGEGGSETATGEPDGVGAKLRSIEGAKLRFDTDRQETAGGPADNGQLASFSISHLRSELIWLYSGAALREEAMAVVDATRPNAGLAEQTAAARKILGIWRRMRHPDRVLLSEALIGSGSTAANVGIDSTTFRKSLSSPLAPTARQELIELLRRPGYHLGAAGDDAKALVTEFRSVLMRVQGKLSDKDLAAVHAWVESSVEIEPTAGHYKDFCHLLEALIENEAADQRDYETLRRSLSVMGESIDKGPVVGAKLRFDNSLEHPGTAAAAQPSLPVALTTGPATTGPATIMRDVLAGTRKNSGNGLIGSSGHAGRVGPKGALSHDGRTRVDLDNPVVRRSIAWTRDEFEPWLTGPLKLEKPHNSAWHKLADALRSGDVFGTHAMQAGRRLTDMTPALFVIEHDWAAAFAGARDYENGEYRMPYPECCFEFRISGYRVLVLVAGPDGVPDWPSARCYVLSKDPVSGDNSWCCFPAAVLSREADPRPVDPRFAWMRSEPLYRLIASQVRAVSISLEAEVAETRTVAAPARLNKARNAKGKSLLRDYHVVVLARRASGRPKQDRAGHDADHARDREPRWRVRLHFRRGHWRHYHDGAGIETRIETRIEAGIEMGASGGHNHLWQSDPDPQGRHYCTSCSAYRRWLRWTLVGNPELGFIDKHYRL